MVQITNFTNIQFVVFPNNTSAATFNKVFERRGSTVGRLKSEHSRLPPSILRDCAAPEPLNG